MKAYNMPFASSDSGYAGLSSDGALRLTWLSGTGSSSSYTAPHLAGATGTWDFYAFVFTVTEATVNINVYRNDQLVTTGNVAGSMRANTLVAIGARNSKGEHSLAGALDEFRIYNRALNLYELRVVYEDGLGSVGTP
jgi:hypothetical protein